MMQEVSQKEHLNLLKQYKGTDRRYRLKVLQLHRLYRSFNCTPIGLCRFSKLLSDSRKQKNPLMVLKYLILIHGTIQFNYYSDCHLQNLLEFNLNPDIESSDKMQQWIIEIIGGYFKYLSKISFHGDIYQRSLTLKYQTDECLIDYFMILNQLNAYSHQAKSVFNCAGRYYFNKLYEIQQFFDILQNQFTNLYLLLRSIGVQIIKKAIIVCRVFHRTRQYQRQFIRHAEKQTLPKKFKNIVFVIKGGRRTEYFKFDYKKGQLEKLKYFGKQFMNERVDTSEIKLQRMDKKKSQLI